MNVGDSVRTLAFLGPSGTYTEEAALLYDPSAEIAALSQHLGRWASGGGR